MRQALNRSMRISHQAHQDHEVFLYYNNHSVKSIAIRYIADGTSIYSPSVERRPSQCFSTFNILFDKVLQRFFQEGYLARMIEIVLG